MLTTAQLRMRRSGLTATDMSKLSGENPWGSAIQVYEEKLAEGDPAEDASPVANNRAVTGQIMEAGIARRYVWEVTPPGMELRIVQVRKTFRHPTMTWALATPDRFVFAFDKDVSMTSTSLEKDLRAGAKALRLLECKLVGSRVARHWNLDEEDDAPDCDRIPTYVYVQVQWQMFVCGYDTCDVAALLNGTTFKWFRIERDQAFIDALCSIGETFWQKHVLARVPPAPDGTRAYAQFLDRLYPNPVRPLIEAPPEAYDLALAYHTASQTEADAKKKRELLGQKLRALIGDAAGLQAGWGSVHLIGQRGRIQWAELAKDLNISADVIERYRGAVSRSIRVLVTQDEELF